VRLHVFSCLILIACPDFLPHKNAFLNVCLEGCTLTTNEAHGIRLCPFEIVMVDLEERNLDSNGLSNLEKRRMLEQVLREEEEW
jgi:hypothetical protein